MHVHKGELVENAVRKKSFPIKLLAQRLGKSRTHVYNLFDNADVSLDVIIQIGKIIQYDFSKDLDELSKLPEEYRINSESSAIESYETISYWKSKYFELVDQHKLLLQDKLKEYFEKLK